MSVSERLTYNRSRRPFTPANCVSFACCRRRSGPVIDVGVLCVFEQPLSSFSLPFSSEPSLSNAAVVARLLRLAWRYRGWCLLMLVLQAILMGLAVLLVQLGGATIDVIRFHAGGTQSLPPLPLGYSFPVDWSPMTQVIVLSVVMMGSSVVRALLELCLRNGFGNARAPQNCGRPSHRGLCKAAEAEHPLL